MAWTSMKAWSGSEVLTSADQNTYVGSNIQYCYDNKPEANQWINGTTNVAQENRRIESGVASKGSWLNQASAGSVAVTFNTAFGSAPQVVATLEAVIPHQYSVSVRDVGTGQFLLYLGKITAGTTTANGSAYWIAIGA